MNLRQHVQHLFNTETQAAPGQHGTRSGARSYRKPNRFALVYPGTYQLGMSSLGVQVIHAILNSRQDTACERVFIPERRYLQELQKRNP